jgi:hypothetical protein
MISTDAETWTSIKQGPNEECMLIHTGMKYPAEVKWKKE